MNIDFSEIDSLQQSWVKLRQRREKSDPNVYRNFLEQIYREWAIETGLIEGLYHIDEGTTVTLVREGLLERLIEPGSTDKNSRDVIQAIRDHREAAEFVTDSIRNKQQFTKFYVRQLHQILLRNQEFYVAYDQFRNPVKKELHHGRFKLEPNSPTRIDGGGVHEYCPPEQTDSEVENLISLYVGYQKDGGEYHSLSVAAWLHHRFTQVHPFEDGNGRVARALLTWHLARENYLPVVVSRHHKSDYLDALESADDGDLEPFIRFIVRLERQVILKALGADAMEPAPRVFDQVLERVAQLAKQRVETERNDLRKVNQVSTVMRESALAYVGDRSKEIENSLDVSGIKVRCETDWGGPENQKEHWYRSQIVKTAGDLKYWVNFNEQRHFVKLSINRDFSSSVPRLDFVISLHHVGRQLNGIVAASAFAQIIDQAENENGQRDKSVETDLKTCSSESFTFVAESDLDQTADLFHEWIEHALSVAYAYWGQYFS